MAVIEISKRLAEKTMTVYERLLEAYGFPDWRSHTDPLSELVLTFLSQHTSDLNSGRAFERLRQRYPTWDDAVNADPHEFCDTIRSGGLANVKGPRIQAALRRIRDERGDFDLNFLLDLSDDDARQWLTAIPGVGPKTAACVLMFSCGKPIMPVDTHVHRVARRIGLVPWNASAEQTELILENMLPYDTPIRYAFHLNLISHGRQVCKAQNPRCAVCVVQDRCDWYARGRKDPAGDV